MKDTSEKVYLDLFLFFAWNCELLENIGLFWSETNAIIWLAWLAFKMTYNTLEKKHT